MPRWFDMAEVDASVFTKAPHVDVRVMDLAASADEVWGGLTEPRPVGWCRRLANGHYTSPTPYGVGTTREISALGVLKLRERFFEWDDAARRHSFYVTDASLPLFEYFAEDYLVEPTDGGCRFTWTFALKARRGLSAPVSLSLPLNRRVLYDSFARDTVHRFGAAR